MSWSIFGRLFWKVWREDWKRWASVLAVGVAALLLFQSTEAMVSWINMVILWILVYVFTTMAAGRGKRDSFIVGDSTISYKIPSIVFVIIWTAISALALSRCLYIPFECPISVLVSFLLVWIISAGVTGYALGIWAHPWLPAIITTLVIMLGTDNIYYYGDASHTVAFPALSSLNIAITSSVILYISLTQAVKRKTRWPVIFQFATAACIIWAFTTVVAHLSNDGIRTQDMPKSITSSDRSLQASCAENGYLVLNDLKTKHSYTLDIKKHGSWDTLVPLAVCSNKSLLATAFDRQKQVSQIIQWNYRSNQVKTILNIDNSQYYEGSEGVHIGTVSEDGRLMLLKLRSKLGQGCDYWLLDIRTHEMKIIMSNAYPKYDMEIPTPTTAIFTDREHNRARLLNTSTLVLGPILGWKKDSTR